MANKFLVRLGATSTLATNGGSGSIAVGDTKDTASNAKKILLGDSYKTTSTTLVNEGRNTAGTVISSVIRSGIRKIELSWKVISASEYQVLATFFNTNFMFYAYYFDTDTGTWLTKHFYVGDRSVSAVRNKQINTATGTGGGLGVDYYENFKISLIEV